MCVLDVCVWSIYGVYTHIHTEHVYIHTFQWVSVGLFRVQEHMHLTSGCTTEEKVSVSGTHGLLSMPWVLWRWTDLKVELLPRPPDCAMIISLYQQARFHFSLLLLKWGETSSPFVIQAACTDKLAQTRNFYHLLLLSGRISGVSPCVQLIPVILRSRKLVWIISVILGTWEGSE